MTLFLKQKKKKKKKLLGCAYRSTSALIIFQRMFKIKIRNRENTSRQNMSVKIDKRKPVKVIFAGNKDYDQAIIAINKALGKFC